MVDADVAAAFAQGSVPAGITIEYLEQSRDRPAIVTIIVLTVLVSIVVILRCFSRVYMVRSFGLDDGLALLSYACFIAFVTFCFILIREGSGRHLEYIQYVLTQSQTNRTEVNDYVAHLIYTAALFICRLSGLAFFYRLSSRHRALRRAVLIAAVFLVCAFLIQFFLILAHCSPVTGLWPYAWQPNANDYKCVTWGTVYVTNSGLSLVCDFVIFTIPLAMIRLLQLSKGRKIMLAFILMPGVAVIGISIARLYLCVVGQWAADGSWYYDPQLTIEVCEVGGTLMALSAPGIKPLFSSCYSRAKSSASSLARTMNTTVRKTLRFEIYTSGSDEVTDKKDSPWLPDGAFGVHAVKTSVNADGSMAKRHPKGSDDEFCEAGDIMVQREVDQTSTPLGLMGLDDFDLEKQDSVAQKEP